MKSRSRMRSSVIMRSSIIMRSRIIRRNVKALLEIDGPSSEGVRNIIKAGGHLKGVNLTRLGAILKGST